MRAIFFDFDGTLADTAPGIVLTMQSTFRELGLSVPSEEAVRQTIGLPLGDALPLLGAPAAEGMAVYQRLFPSCELTHISIFPEVRETLSRLKANGIRMAICTSRNKESLDSIVTRHGLDGFFETVVTGSDGIPAKPAPDMVLTLLRRMGVGQALVVGDTTFDIGMGNAAGCPTCAVTYGNHSAEQLQTAHPTYIIDRFSQLIPLL